MSESTGGIVDLLVRADALRFGAFTLKDGSASPFFIDLGRVARADHLAELGEHFAAGIARFFPDADTLFGPAYKGIAIATTTAVAMARSGRVVQTFFDRKEAKAHGEGGTFIGHRPTAASRIVVLDDVTTSGATKEDAFRAIEATFGVRPIGVLVAVDRTRKRGARSPALEALNLHALVELSDVVAYLEAKGASEAAVVKQYVESR